MIILIKNHFPVKIVRYNFIIFINISLWSVHNQLNEPNLVRILVLMTTHIKKQQKGQSLKLKHQPLKHQPIKQQLLKLKHQPPQQQNVKKMKLLILMSKRMLKRRRLLKNLKKTLNMRQ